MKPRIAATRLDSSRSTKYPLSYPFCLVATRYPASPSHSRQVVRGTAYNSSLHRSRLCEVTLGLASSILCLQSKKKYMCSTQAKYLAFGDKWLPFRMRRRQVFCLNVRVALAFSAGAVVVCHIIAETMKPSSLKLYTSVRSSGPKERQPKPGKDKPIIRSTKSERCQRSAFQSQPVENRNLEPPTTI